MKVLCAKFLQRFSGWRSIAVLVTYSLAARIILNFRTFLLKIGTVMGYETSNPFLSRNRFADVGYSGGVATLSATINRCLILFALVIFSAAFAWISAGSSPSMSLWAVIGLFTIQSMLCFAISIKKELSPVIAPLCSIIEGLYLGLISKIFEIMYPGIAAQAIGLTFGVAVGMLLLYKAKVISVSNRYAVIVSSIVMGISMFYLIAFVMHCFGKNVPLINDATPMGIAFSLFVTVIAALSLAIDFEFIAQVSEQGLPTHMSWYAAFGLMMTLTWIYLEILRLLAKFRNRK